MERQELSLRGGPPEELTGEEYKILRFSINCVTISCVGSFCKSWYVLLSLRCSWASSRYREVDKTTTTSPLSALDITKSSSFIS